MIRNDFKDGGFPICNRNPVLCVTKEGEVYVAYDRYGLGLAIKLQTTRQGVGKLVGIWPGKINTDVYPLNPQAYTVMPPEEHRDIDNAILITIKYVDKKFSEIVYKLEESHPEIICKDEKLLEYITAVGLKHGSVYK